MSGHWIKGATEHGKGNLHRALGVAEDRTIPQAKVMKASHGDNPRVAKEARLAETLEHLHRKHGKGV